jgi:uncharacterized protein (DUF924 family)
MKDITQSVLQFWFGKAADPADATPQPFWFKSTPDLDADIRTRFGSLLGQARAGAFEGEAATADDHLAVILILDQFSRNIHRGTAAAFAGDALARDWARRIIKNSFDMTQPAPHRRVFCYMPLEHSEDIDDQNDAVRLISAIGDDTYTRFAEAHRDVIVEFGRFPHRNTLLGRPSSRAEVAYLSKKGAGF